MVLYGLQDWRKKQFKAGALMPRLRWKIAKLLLLVVRSLMRGMPQKESALLAKK
jgi:hypothetical protein